MEHERELCEFVNKEIIYCASSLIWELGKKDEDGVMFEDYPNLFQGSPSYGEWECPECFHTWDAEPDEEECPECKEAVDIDDNFQANEYSEILEHWIVSDWLADRLAEQGEAIEKDFLGLTIWGRCCSGQGIALDGVISQIHKNLHSRG